MSLTNFQNRIRSLSHAFWSCASFSGRTEKAQTDDGTGAARRPGTWSYLPEWPCTLRLRAPDMMTHSIKCYRTELAKAALL